MPLVLWVSLYRTFHVGRVFNFLGLWVEQSYISLAFGDFYHPVPPPMLLWRPSSSSTDSLLLNLPSTVPHVPSACQALPSCAEVQGSTAQPHIPARCHLQRSHSDILTVPSPAALTLFSHSVFQLHSSSPSCLFPMPQVLVRFTWAIDPASFLGEKPQFLCSCSQALPEFVTHPQPWCHCARCFATLCHG